MSDLISRSVYRNKLEVAFRTLTRELDEAIRIEDEELRLAIRNQQSAYHIALQILDAQPTAYDVEKVVAELEKEGRCYARYSVNTDGVKSIPTHEAVAIVRKGGVE